MGRIQRGRALAQGPSVRSEAAKRRKQDVAARLLTFFLMESNGLSD